jgi:hypothetical protein
MATTITLPDFNFSAFYYPELLEALIAYKRLNVPELTEELPQDPYIQFLRMMACVGHISNTTIDLVANESFLRTAKLVEPVREILKSIGYEMEPATPANVDIVYELSKVFSASFTLIGVGSQAATQRNEDGIITYYEALEALTIDRTDQLSSCLASEDGVYTDYTAKANSSVTPGDDFTPWNTPVSKDAIYWGHKHIMWDELALQFTTPSANIDGVFEYYDGNWQKTAPTSVSEIGGGQLEINLTSLLGTQNRQGTEIRVQLNSSYAYENVYSTWNGSANIATVGLLGQTSPSTTPTDYAVGSDWVILEATDGTNNLTQDGSVSYELPQNLTQNWETTEVNGITAYWLRYRITTVATPTSPVIIDCKIDANKQYALRSTTQGRTYADDPLGSSTGLADQTFETSQEHYINGSGIVTVDGVIWSEVDNFLASKPGDRHYQIQLGENDKATVVFGNGVNGRIPTLGVGNVSIEYRYGANENGNVGANTITVDKTGLTYVNKLWNPRQATGWAEADGASEASLELAKVKGPASLRIKDIAVSADDVKRLAVTTYKDSNGSSPFSRSIAIEEGYGPKTIELVVVARGGNPASTAQLEELEKYFNGDKYSYPVVDSHLVANQKVVAVNYDQKSINITAVVYGNTTSEAIVNKLQRVLQPEAKKEDGITYEWEFGGEVPVSRITHEIFETSELITKVELSQPASDVTLQPRELPVPGALSIIVVLPS